MRRLVGLFVLAAGCSGEESAFWLARPGETFTLIVRTNGGAVISAEALPQGPLALSLTSGEQIWALSYDQRPRGVPISGPLALAAGGVLLEGPSDALLLEVDGSAIWSPQKVESAPPLQVSAELGCPRIEIAPLAIEARLLDVAVRRDGTILAGDNTGAIHHIDPSTGADAVTSLGTVPIKSLEITSDQRVYAGTSDGILELDRDSFEIIRRDQGSPEIGDAVVEITAAEAGPEALAATGNGWLIHTTGAGWTLAGHAAYDSTHRRVAWVGPARFIDVARGSRVTHLDNGLIEDLPMGGDYFDASAAGRLPGKGVLVAASDSRTLHSLLLFNELTKVWTQEIDIPVFSGAIRAFASYEDGFIYGGTDTTIGVYLPDRSCVPEMGTTPDVDRLVPLDRDRYLLLTGGESIAIVSLVLDP